MMSPALCLDCLVTYHQESSCYEKDGPNAKGLDERTQGKDTWLGE